MSCRVQLVDTDGSTVLEKIANYQKANKEVRRVVLCVTTGGGLIGFPWSCAPPDF